MDVQERRLFARPLATYQPAFEVRQRVTRTLDVLWRRLSGPVCDQSIRILWIGRLDQPGGTERIGGLRGPRHRLQGQPLQPVEGGAPGIDAEVFIELTNCIDIASAFQVQRRQRCMNLQFRLGVGGLQPRSQLGFGRANLAVPPNERRGHGRQLSGDQWPFITIEACQ